MYIKLSELYLGMNGQKSKIKRPKPIRLAIPRLYNPTWIFCYIY